MKQAASIALTASFVLVACYNAVDEPLGYRQRAPAAVAIEVGASCADAPSKVFSSSCAGCHGASRAESDLDLVSPGVAARVVGKPARSGGLLVDPEHPEESIVYARLFGKKGPRMPMGAPQLGPSSAACVLTWIRSLASPPSNGSEPGRPPLGTPAGSEPGVAPPGSAGTPQSLPTIRIGAGAGADHVDQDGQTWSADTGFSGGQTATKAPPVPIAGSTEDALYNHERWGGDGSGNFVDFRYTFALPDGAYRLTLKFAETYSGAMGVGLRQFDVAVGGTKVLTDFDIFASAGANAAIDKTFDVNVSGGQLVVDFQRGASQAPKVGAIAVVPR